MACMFWDIWNHLLPTSPTANWNVQWSVETTCPEKNLFRWGPDSEIRQNLSFGVMTRPANVHAKEHRFVAVSGTKVLLGIILNAFLPRSRDGMLFCAFEHLLKHRKRQTSQFPVMLANQFHKPSRSHHNFDRWYICLPFPVMGGLWHCFTYNPAQSFSNIFQPSHCCEICFFQYFQIFSNIYQSFSNMFFQKMWFQGAKADHEIPQCAGSRR